MPHREAFIGASCRLGGPPTFERRAGAELLVEGLCASAFLAWFNLAWLAASACLACCSRPVQYSAGDEDSHRKSYGSASGLGTGLSHSRRTLRSSFSILSRYRQEPMWVVRSLPLGSFVG